MYIKKTGKTKTNHMKKIHVIATTTRRVITVACQTDIPRLLNRNEIQDEWFYESPDMLEDFLNQQPDILEYFLKGFSYWIECRVKGFNEHPQRYGKLKRLIRTFSKQLFEDVRRLAIRIAKQVRKVIKPIKQQYKDLRLLKRRQLGIDFIPSAKRKERPRYKNRKSA